MIGLLAKFENVAYTAVSLVCYGTSCLIFLCILTFDKQLEAPSEQTGEQKTIKTSI